MKIGDKMFYLIKDPEHKYWWRADGNGYTEDVAFAGLYNEKESLNIINLGRGDTRYPLNGLKNMLVIELKLTESKLKALKEKLDIINNE